MSCDLLGALWVLGGLVGVILLANHPIIFGVVISIPWFWLAWMAAEQGCPLWSLMLFLDGAALLWMCVYMHWRRTDRPRTVPG